jgi:hypothetical protein
MPPEAPVTIATLFGVGGHDPSPWVWRTDDRRLTEARCTFQNDGIIMHIPAS